jgi:hypothetical protein
MDGYFEALPLPVGQRIEKLSRLAFELREDRRRLLAGHGAQTEEELLERIDEGSVDAEAAYDHYLDARMLAAAREAVRGELQAVLGALEAGAWTR